MTLGGAVQRLVVRPSPAISGAWYGIGPMGFPRLSRFEHPRCRGGWQLTFTTN